MKKKSKYKYKEVFSVRNFLITSLAILLFFVFDKLKKPLFIFILVGINCFFAYLKHLFFRYIRIGRVAMLRHMVNAIEFITFSTVLGSFVFGPVTGMIIGGLSILGTYIFEKRISQFSLATVPLYILLGYLTFILKSYIIDVRYMGIVISIAYNLLINLILIIFYKAKFIKMLCFSLFNLLFNIYLFYNFTFLLVNIIN
ncbi:hypothetical protein JXB41_02380 [Candidatus Woesearchaeota archaeon]|nr:hypothetical protein [Candidatus Woesearchaeota archaeon]